MDAKHGAEGWHVVCLVLQWKAGNDGAQIVEVTKPTVFLAQCEAGARE